MEEKEAQPESQQHNMKPIKKVYEEMMSNLLEKRNEYLENLYEEQEEIQNVVIDSPKISDRKSVV